MAQHDFSIANASGAAFRSDLNNALNAIATTNAGTTQPTTTYEYQLWADSTNGLLKQRNSTNSAWLELGKLGVAYGLGMPTGTRVLFQQTSAPTGWTKDASSHNDKALRVVTGTVGSGGSTAFSSVFGSGKITGAVTLAESQIPSHAHGPQGGFLNIVGDQVGGGQGGAAGAGRGLMTVTGNTGGGGSHDHTLNLNPLYCDAMIAQKD